MCGKKTKKPFYWVIGRGSVRLRVTELRNGEIFFLTPFRGGCRRLKIKSRTPHMLGKHLTTELHPSLRCWVLMGRND